MFRVSRWKLRENANEEKKKVSAGKSLIKIKHTPSSQLLRPSSIHPLSPPSLPASLHSDRQHQTEKMDPEMARLQVLSDPEMMARLREVTSLLLSS
jgi:hypothetical protein